MFKQLCPLKFGKAPEGKPLANQCDDQCAWKIAVGPQGRCAMAQIAIMLADLREKKK